jgi:chromosome segregation ATPase
MLQTLLTPQLSGISERLARIEEHQAGVGHSLAAVNERLGRVEERLGGIERDLTAMREQAKSFRNEMDSFSRQSHADFATVEGEIRRIDQITDLRERLASVEAKLSAHQGSPNPLYDA